ncbi:hypothetical protein OC835_000169 [Tilletia horrida]|nr:hypothetical protein OC835_000169 [Tilletia horrida]
MTSRSRSKGKRKDPKVTIPAVNEFGEPLPPIGGERIKRRKHIPSQGAKKAVPSASFDHLLDTHEDAAAATADDSPQIDHAFCLSHAHERVAKAPPPLTSKKRKRGNTKKDQRPRASIKFAAWHNLVNAMQPFLQREHSGEAIPRGNPLAAPSSEQHNIKIPCTSQCSGAFRQAIRVYRLDRMHVDTFDSSFHFDLLRFYAASRDWSDSNAMSFANTLAQQWDLLSSNDGIRKQLGSASMWFTAARTYLHDAEGGALRGWTKDRPHYKDDDLQLSLQDLVRRCPACFAHFLSSESSCPPSYPSQADPKLIPELIVSIDGNFTHCRQAEADHVEKNPCPPAFFLSQAQVQKVATSMDRLAKKHSVGALRDQINACSANVKAADERAAKGAYGLCDITGLVGLCCRHDIPLVFCDITSPGERHHYAIALLQMVITAVPMLKHIGVLYDIGCRFPNKRNIAELLRARVTWAVSVFHVYGHNYRCQVLYSPRRKLGFAWSDGEGMERVWSALADIIPSERLMSHGERHLTLECRLRHIGERHLIELFDTLDKKKERLREAAIEARSRLRARHTFQIVLTLFYTIRRGKDVDERLSKFDCPAHLQFLPRKVAYALTVMAKRRLLHVSRTEDRGGLRPAYTILAEQLLAKIGSVRSLRDQQRGRTKGLRGQTPVQLLKIAEAADRKAALALLPRLLQAVRRRKRAPHEQPLKPITPAQLFTDNGESWVAHETQSHRAWWSYPPTARAIDAYLVLQQVADEQARLRREKDALETWLRGSIMLAFATDSTSSSPHRQALMRIYLRWYRPSKRNLASASWLPPAARTFIDAREANIPTTGEIDLRAVAEDQQSCELL